MVFIHNFCCLGLSGFRFLTVSFVLFSFGLLVCFVLIRSTSVLKLLIIHACESRWANVAASDTLFYMCFSPPRPSQMIFGLFKGQQTCYDL